jgi:transaldolase
VAGFARQKDAMDLFLDSVDPKEIEQAFELGFVKGLTTTPTFMHRHGITDVDAAIVKLSGMVPELHVEALGETHDQIVGAVHRLLDMPIKREPVFKIPVSLSGLRAACTLVKEGRRVNVHLIYTLNQAYMAMAAGASFVCPLAGRLQDQGHDAIRLFEECLAVRDQFHYPAKIMFSSVRHPEHVRQAALVGADVCTVPWGVMQRLCDNALTAVGTNQFLEHTKLMTMRIKEIIRATNPMCKLTDTVTQAMVRMTESRLGAVTVVNERGQLTGIFTDGDLRRQLQKHGQSILTKSMAEVGFTDTPKTVSSDALLYEAVNLFNKHQIDNIVVTDNDLPVGILDVQDLVEMGLLG